MLKQGQKRNHVHRYDMRFSVKKAKDEDAKTLNERNLAYVNEIITKYDKQRSENQIKDLAKEIFNVTKKRHWNLS